MIAQESTVAAMDRKNPPKQPRVLVVEDEAPVRLLLREALSDDYDVDTAADGAQGLALFQMVQHDIVLTDVMMPNMTGWDLARHLRRMNPTLPIVILTAYGEGLEDDARCHGVLLMHKPVNLDAVSTTLADALAEARR